MLYVFSPFAMAYFVSGNLGADITLLKIDSICLALFKSTPFLNESHYKKMPVHKVLYAMLKITLNLHAFIHTHIYTCANIDIMFVYIHTYTYTENNTREIQFIHLLF